MLPLVSERVKNEDDDAVCFVFASGIGSKASVDPGGANAGGVAASNLKQFGVPSAAPAAAAAEFIFFRTREERRASFTAMTNAFPQRLYSMLMNWPTTSSTKYRLNLVSTIRRGDFSVNFP